MTLNGETLLNQDAHVWHGIYPKNFVGLVTSQLYVQIKQYVYFTKVLSNRDNTVQSIDIMQFDLTTGQIEVYK